MRIRKALISSAVSLMIAIFQTPSAHAQTFFQKIFGGSDVVAVPQRIYAPRSYRLPASRFYRRGVRPPLDAGTGERDSDIGPPDSDGPYRTMCVRPCDGFYFPLRAHAWHSDFSSDIRSCRAACGSEARLFYSPSSSASTADDMMDLGGRKYSELPHAFAYRKALVQGCTCKPVPWSVEEEQRHKAYAAQEAREKAKDEAFLRERASLQENAAPDTTITAETRLADALASWKPVSTGAAEGSSVGDALAADEPAPDSIAAEAEQPTPRKRTARGHRAKVQRVRYVPSSASFFGKPIYVWPSDR
jgi:hypothetical protein